MKSSKIELECEISVVSYFSSYGIGYAVYCYGDRRVKVYVLLDSEGLGACKISEDETFSRIEQALMRHYEVLGSGIEVIKL